MKMRWWQLVVLGVLLMLTACGGGDDDTGRQAAPTTHDDVVPPAVANMEPCPTRADRSFEFRAVGHTISGHARGRGPKVAIMSHQFRGSPCDLAALAVRLHGGGYRVVSWTADPSPSADALRAVVKRERARGARSVVLVGASAGGALSLYVGGTARPPVDAIVALSPSEQAANSGDVLRAARRHPGPIMVVAGELDPGFADLPAELRAAHKGPESIEVVAGSGDHGKDFVSERDSEVADQVVEFLRTSLNSGGAS